MIEIQANGHSCTLGEFCDAAGSQSRLARLFGVEDTGKLFDALVVIDSDSDESENARSVHGVLEAYQLLWIRLHGSIRLKRCVTENIECTAAFRDEWLARELPGWEWIADLDVVGGESKEPRNPPEEAFELLDRAREMAPDAALVYVEFGDPGETDWARYCAEIWRFERFAILR